MAIPTASVELLSGITRLAATPSPLEFYSVKIKPLSAPREQSTWSLVPQEIHHPTSALMLLAPHLATPMGTTSQAPQTAAIFSVNSMITSRIRSKLTPLIVAQLLKVKILYLLSTSTDKYPQGQHMFTTSPQLKPSAQPHSQTALPTTVQTAQSQSQQA